MSKHTVFLLIGLMCCLHVSGQKGSYEQIKGDTYRWNFVAGWELSPLLFHAERPLSEDRTFLQAQS